MLIDMNKIGKRLVARPLLAVAAATSLLACGSSTAPASTQVVNVPPASGPAGATADAPAPSVAASAKTVTSPVLAAPAPAAPAAATPRTTPNGRPASGNVA